MTKNILYDLFGYKKVRWMKIIVLGIIIFCLLFSGVYSAFFGKFLTWSYQGIPNIPAKILAVILFFIAQSDWGA